MTKVIFYGFLYFLSVTIGVALTFSSIHYIFYFIGKLNG